MRELQGLLDPARNRDNSTLNRADGLTVKGNRVQIESFPRPLSSFKPALLDPYNKSSTGNLTSNIEDEIIDDISQIRSVTTNNLENYHSWNIQSTLNKYFYFNSHYDSIRSICFHPCDLSLFTASEDHTLKLWRLSPFSDQKY
jgi:WD40 repeat protein